MHCSHNNQVEEWASVVLGWAQTYGVSDSVMLLEDLSSGDDVRGTGALWGVLATPCMLMIA
jgi:hypothetical protein